MLQVNCPICGQSLNKELIAKFYFCDACELSVRTEADMPDFHYNDQWIETQKEAREVRRRAQYLLSLIPYTSVGKKLLDIGCGIGVCCDIAAQKGYRVVGIDSSEKNIVYAKANKRGDYQVGTLDSLQTTDRFDVVIAQQIIEHIRDTKDFLGRISNLLNPGGMLLVETPNVVSWNPNSYWRKRIGGMFYGLEHRIVFSPKSLRTVLEQNGFRVSLSKTKTFSPTYLSETIELLMQGNHPVTGMTTQATDSEAKTKVVTKLSIASRMYRWFINSVLADVVTVLPNYLSQRHDRGNQLIAVAIKQI
jgi:2-polyprenyl-3-methyl-5-hydroxy-6-metoxy-1,4-benzoquinol methylase